jgi:hypothetical protein
MRYRQSPARHGGQAAIAAELTHRLVHHREPGHTGSQRRRVDDSITFDLTEPDITTALRRLRTAPGRPAIQGPIWSSTTTVSTLTDAGRLRLHSARGQFTRLID